MKKKDTKRFSRVTIDLSENAHRRLAELELLVGSSKADIFREALRLYDWAVHKYTSGGDFFAVDAEGHQERVVLLGSALPSRPREVTDDAPPVKARALARHR